MLRIFNKFLSRLRSTHEIFGEKRLFVLILEYLSGKDLFQVYQVSYYFRTVLQSVSILEITMLKYTVYKSNKSIAELKKSEEQKIFTNTLNQKPFNINHHITKNWKTSENRKNVKELPLKIATTQETPNFNEEKWVNFTRYFHDYAQQNGLKILKRADFDDEMQWKDYKLKYITFYHNYIDHIKKEKQKMDKIANSRVSLLISYSSFMDCLKSKKSGDFSSAKPSS